MRLSCSLALLLWLITGLSNVGMGIFVVEPPYEPELGTSLTKVGRSTSLSRAGLLGGVWLGIIEVVDLEAEGAIKMTEKSGQELDDCVESREEVENLLSHDGVWWGANVGDTGGEASAPCRKDGVTT